MSFDLLNYLQLEDHPQPDDLTQAFKRLFMAQRQSADAASSHEAIDAYMAQVKAQIGTGVLHGWNAAGALFVGEALAAAWRAKGSEGGKAILGFVMQLSMSEAQWAMTQQAIQSDAKAKDAREVLRVAHFPPTVLEHLFKRGERDILREIYQGTHGAIDAALQRAMHEPHNFEEWQAHLGVLAAYLTLRRWLPINASAESKESANSSTKPQRHPMVAWLFNAAEISALEQQDTFAANCFSHLFDAHFGGLITQERQQEVAQDYAQRLAQDTLDAHRWLNEGKGRFEIAPYLS